MVNTTRVGRPLAPKQVPPKQVLGKNPDPEELTHQAIRHPVDQLLVLG